MNDGEHGPPVGNVGEEAAKLFGALQDWVKLSGATSGSESGDVGPGQPGLGDQWRSINDHVAGGGEDCTYCPVCQLIHRVREASPELRTHLAVATSSLLQAAATLLEARANRSAAAEQRVTKIDLDDDAGPAEGDRV